MCGRIARVKKSEELSDMFDVTKGSEHLEGMYPSYNIPPSSRLPALVAGRTGLAWASFTWGFLPSWKRDGRPMINARIETVTDKPMFRSAFHHRRCVLPATAYYEWLAQPGGGKKQPYCIRPATEEPLLLAGIYENGTCAILTREVRMDLAFIHHRMPVALPADLLESYLEIPDPVVAEATDSLSLRAYPVTRRMGSPFFDDASCLVPLST